MRGHATQVSISKSSPTDKPLEFISSSIREYDGLIGADGSETRRGRSRHQYHLTAGIGGAGGTLVIEPCPDDLDLLLELAMGTAIATDVVALAETVPYFYVDQSYSTVDAIRFSSGKMDRISFSSRQGGKLQMSADCEFLTYDDTITYPTFAASAFSSKIPYAHQNSVCTIDGVEFQSPEWEVTIDNFLNKDSWENSNRRVDLEEADRLITLRGSPKFAAAVKTKFGAALRAGLAGTLVYTLGGDSLTFAFAALTMPLEGVELGGKTSDIRKNLAFMAVETNSAKELVVTNVST